MISLLISIIVVCLIVGVIIWIVNILASYIPPPFGQIITVIAVIIGLIAILYMLVGVLPAGGHLGLTRY